MGRHLFIVSREHPGLYEYLVVRFHDDANVRVLVDRRVTERRVTRAHEWSNNDRRARDRRQPVPVHDDLRLRSHRIVTLDDSEGHITTPQVP